MKKIILSLMLSLCVVTVWSQIGWSVDTIAADEMKGTSSYEFVSYYSEDCLLGYRLDFPNYFVLSTNEGIFDAEYISFLKQNRVGGQVGLYDENDNFIKKFTCPLSVKAGSYHRGVSEGGKEVNTEIIKFLETEKGWVRFIYQRYGKADLDVKVPCRHNE